MRWSEFSFILKPSRLGGIGVFATHDIASGEQIFRDPFEPRVLNRRDIPEEFLKYCIFINDDEAICPKHFDRMEIGWFINHSEKPNIARTNGTQSTIPITAKIFIDSLKRGSVISITNIKAGDEILIDYNSLNEPEHVKDTYYKPKLLAE